MFLPTGFLASFERTLPSVSYTGTSLFLKPLFNILLILYRVFRSCLPAASSASSASLSTNFLLSSLVIFFTSRSNSEYFLLSWSRTRSDWVEVICCLTPLLVSIFSQVFPCIHSSFFLFLIPRTFSPAGCLEYLTKGVDFHLLFFLRNWKRFFSSRLKSCLIRLSFNLLESNWCALPCLLRALHSFSERTATNKL